MDLPAPTARLVFRAWSAEDLALARALWGDPKVTEMIGGPFSEDEIQERLDAELERGRRHGLQYWPAFLAGRGELVGCCGLRPKDLERGLLELGFHLLPEFWGRGFAVEAASAVIRHAFERCGADALFAGHHPENVASRKTLAKLCFRHTHDELYPPTGRMHPSYALTRAEFLLRGRSLEQ